jgi:hypothetical protein
MKHALNNPAGPELRWTRWLTAVVLTAAVTRAAGALAIGDRFYFADEAIYVDAAYRLLDGAGLGPDFRQAPGYPVLVAVFAAVVPSSILAIRLAQSALAALGSVVVYALAERLAGRGPALAAAAIYAVDPLLVVSAGLLYPETLAAVLLATAILAAWRGGLDSVGYSGLSGVLLGCLALVRPVALVILPVVAIWIAFQVPRRRAPAHLGLVTVATLLVLAPWTYRNYRIHGRLAPIAVAGAHTAPVAPQAVAESGLTVALLEQAWTNPAVFAARTVRQFFQFWELAPTRLTTDDPERRATLHRRDQRLSTDALVPAGARDLVSIIASTLEFGLALLGLVLLWRTRRAAALLVIAVSIAFGLGYALFVAKLRYRIPILPLIFVLSGVGAWKLGTMAAALVSKRAGQGLDGRPSLPG